MLKHDVRRAFGLEDSAPFRVVYVAGPGDVVGTYRHWKEGHQDPRVPVRTYSSMFYDMVERIDGKALVLHDHAAGQQLDDGRFRFRAISSPNAPTRFAHLKAQLLSAVEIARQTNAFAPHVALISSQAPDLVMRFLRSDIRIISSIHNTYWPMGQPPSGPKAALKRALQRAFLKPVDAALCTSEECARQFRALRGEQAPTAVEQPVMSEAIEPKQPSRGIARLVYVGRMETSKGIFMLLDVFERLAKTYPSLELAYVGDGGALAALRERAEASAFADRIRVVGRLPASGVHEALMAADLLVCPTLSSFLEGLALVGLEAAARGVPSVVSSVVPAQDFLGSACRTFKADSASDLEETLHDLIENSESYRELCVHSLEVAKRLEDDSDSWGRQLERLLLN